MKKIHASTLLIFLTLTSCKKKHDCVCSTPTLESAQTINDTKKNATNKCADIEKEFQTQYPDMKCKLQ